MSIILISCTDNQENFTEILTEDQVYVKNIDPILFSIVNFESKKEFETEFGVYYIYNLKDNNKSYLIKDTKNNFSLVTNNGEKISHKYIENEVVSEFDFKLNNDYGYKMIDTSKYKANYNLFQKNAIGCEGDYWISVGICAIGAVAIAASDGPLPFADAVAATFLIGCEHTAFRSLQMCVELGKE